MLAGNVGNMCLKLACVNNLKHACLKHACLNMHVKTCCVNGPLHIFLKRPETSIVSIIVKSVTILFQLYCILLCDFKLGIKG